MRRRVPIKWFFITISFISLLYVFDVLQFRTYNDKFLKPLENKYTIETSGCKIPHLELYQEDILNLAPNQSDISYSCGKPPFIVSNETSLYFDRSALKEHGFEDESRLDCGYRPFWRVDPTRSDQDDTLVKFGERTRFKTDVNIEDEFVRVDCRLTGGGSVVFTDFYSFVPSKKWERIEKNDQLLNVVIFGIDSLSRMHLHRKMPKTVEALQKVGAIEMFGYNKVEDNTFPNLVPLLSGLSWLELIKHCWPSYKTRFDKCRFIFHDFARVGYLTSWAEERSDFGIFNYLKKGWTHQPVDIYWNTFDEEARHQIGHNYFFNYPYCHGSRPAFLTAIEHSERVISGGIKYNRPFFSFTWITTLTHDNYQTATIGDKYVADYILKLLSNGYLDRSIFLIMSDHGYRWGAMAQNQQGHLENRLPFMFWRLPPNFIENNPEKVKNLNENARRLITTYDVYATLLHILGNYTKKFERSISLFTPIPETRTCDTADIPAHYCTCFEPLPIDVDQPRVRTAADFIIRHVNDLLSGHECSKLTLSDIKSADLIVAGDSSKGLQLTTSDYTLVLKINPKGALISGTVRFLGDAMQIAGTVNRLDRYGNQSHCVSDPILKLYCQCLS